MAKRSARQSNGEGTLAPNQAFLLAYTTLRAINPIFGRRILYKARIKRKEARVLKRLAGLGWGKVTEDDGDLWFTPDDGCKQFAKTYQPDTPQRQVILWTVKAPRLTRLAPFINEHVKGYRASLIDWSYNSERKHPASRISFGGSTRRGKRLEVHSTAPMKKPARLHMHPVFTLNGADPNEKNERVVRWIVEKLGIRSDHPW